MCSIGHYDNMRYIQRIAESLTYIRYKTIAFLKRKILPIYTITRTYFKTYLRSRNELTANFIKAYFLEEACYFYRNTFVSRNDVTIIKLLATAAAVDLFVHYLYYFGKLNGISN